MNGGVVVDAAKRKEQMEALRLIIQQWNANRLDLFELSEPNEDLEFHGVMRFYFQDSGQKVATKCIRVASDAPTQAVIETLIEKFRPDMRMLSIPEYALYEIHENGDERRLQMDEKPLLVQLNWHRDDREGRFLLRRIDDKTNVPAVGFQEGGSSFRRKLSKREKKQLKKQEKMNKLKSSLPGDKENAGGVAEKLYTELPETSFTRSISNPEAVMRRRRQQKLERKLQQFRSKDGGPDTGGTLKIYGESLCHDVPYKTLLLSVRDTAAQVVREMLAKYGLEKEADPLQYCLVQVNTASPGESGESKEYHGGTNNREYILDDDECPLAILMNHPMSRGSIMFHVRRRPADYHPRKRKKKPLQQKWNKGSELMEYRYEDSYDRLPFFVELNPDGSDIVTGTPKRHKLHPNVTEVGSERPLNANASQSLQLFGPNVQPRHCVIAHTEGIVTVTPCSRDAETYVNGQRIYETTILQNGAIVKFGRIHNFRFIDPAHDDRSRQRHDSARQTIDYSYDRQSSREDSVSHTGASSPGQNNSSFGGNLSQGANGSSQNYETTFDVDGNVETVSTSSLGNKEETRSQRSVSSSRDGNRLSNYERYPRGTDPILPAVLEFREETEEAFLHAIITDLDPATPHFKLAPTYTLYLVARYRASTHYRPELTPTERAHRLTVLLARVADIIHSVIQERYGDDISLPFWMANSSELLHFLKSDRHISAFSLDAQDILAECVQLAFRNLVRYLQGNLAAVMPNFMSERDDPSPEDENSETVLQVLSSAMDLLRRCRVNAALTIQMFSQLLHFVNAWAFNKIVTNSAYCTRQWGIRLKAKLAQLEVWAERQGLELAAGCHLARIMQAAHLLQAPKYTAEDLATLSSTCFKLNSLQLRALLSWYQPAPDEPRLPAELIENVVRVAENVADELARSDGREVRLEEERDLQLPFLLPEDGYSCDVVRGVPQGLCEFLAPLQHAGLCRLTSQPTSSGLWTIYMVPPEHMGARSPSALSNRSGGYPPIQQEPEIQIIKLNKSNNGMGLSIVAAKGAGQDKLGIYIKSVVKGGAADADGQLQAGDQLLKVDGQSLVGITQEKAAEYLVRTGPTVTLEVAKQGAIYHGLATLLQQPSPVMGRGPRRMSERDLPTRVMNESTHPSDPRRAIPVHAPIQSSKSVPSLNTGGNDYSHGPVSPNTAPTKQHEVFNPGYSRTSSTNSIPQKTFEGQPPPPASANLRSKSSQNLNDPRSPASALPPTGLGSRQSSNPSLQGGPEGERFYQNLSVYRNQELHNGYPSRGKMPSPQTHEEKSAQLQQKGLRGSQSSLHRPPDPAMINSRDRPASAYIPQKDPYSTQHVQNMVPRSLSSRDLMRQEAKLQEMQEELKRREIRGNVTSPQHYPVQPAGHPRPPIHGGHHVMHHQQQQRVPNPGYPYHGQEMFHHPRHAYPPPTAPKPMRHPGPVSGDVNAGRPPEELGYRDSPPPPPPPTSTHPLYQKMNQADNRYTASMGEPPRGGYYPASPGNGSNQHPRQFQFNATNPWEREEKEKEQQRRREAARQWRDQQIAELSALPQRTPQQEEQLRALKLEREFQRRAEEVAKQDDDEEGEDEQENNGLLRMADAPDDGRANAQTNGRPSFSSPPSSSIRSPLEDRARKAEEARRKQLEQEQDERIREATRRREEELRHKHQQQQLLQQQHHQIIPKETSGTTLSYQGHNVTPQSILTNRNVTQQAATPTSSHFTNLGHNNSQYSPNTSNNPQFSGQGHVNNTPQYQNNQYNSVGNAHLNSQNSIPYNSPQKSLDPSHLRLENLVINGPASPQNHQQYNGFAPNYYQPDHAKSPSTISSQRIESVSNFYHQQEVNSKPTSGTQRLDSLLSMSSDRNITPPQPPERGSSFTVMSQTQGVLRNSTSERNSSSNNNNVSSTATIKRVSFHDPNANQPPPPPTSQPPPLEKIREDPNHFINEAESLLASPKSPDGGAFPTNTPGVIGAQEVYKDPRTRLLAAQQQQKQTRAGPLPEKLTFKEKMKMFAMETGEDGTPKDKVKISRAQREIDNLGTPTTSGN